jgi:hypothetical protein
MRVFGLILAAAAAAFLAAPAQAELTKCKMTFNMSGWSLAVKTMKGAGRVTCSNGQSADVTIEGTGIGFTIGKSDIVNGEGSFSEVKDISEIFGTYAVASGHAGATRAVSGWAMTKGEISLAISGEGRGWTLGADIGGFTIRRR